MLNINSNNVIATLENNTGFETKSFPIDTPIKDILSWAKGNTWVTGKIVLTTNKSNK